MSVSSTARKANFTLDQSEAHFDFTFRALVSAPTDIKCIVTTNGVEQLLTYTTNYTVTVDSDGVGGRVTLVSPATLSKGTLTVYRDTTNKQESDYDDYNQFPANTLETDLDRRTMVEQELDETGDRTVKFSITTSVADATLPIPVDGKALKWSGTNGTIVNTTVDIDTTVTEASRYASSASTSALAAASSETSAGSSASSASGYAAAALLSQNYASTSVTTAANYATTAGTSAITAANYASTVTTEGINVVNYAVTASTAATNASLYATTASTQVNLATTQGTLSGLYAQTASTQANLATTQATNSLNSANLASTSATTALGVLKVLVNTVTDNYTLAVSDVNKLIDANSSGTLTISVPLNAQVAIPTGSVIAIRQKGAGQVVIAASNGSVTINTSTGLKMIGIYYVASILKLEADVWTAFGGLEA